MKQSTKQFIRFVVVGVTNTGLDFVVFNALIIIFGLNHGNFRFILFKSISFLVAVTNSFILNRIWVFKERGSSMRKQATSFAVVSAAGLVVNTLISYLFFSIGSALLPNFSAQLIANGSALLGTATVFISNYFGYKFFVFKKSS